MQMQAQPLDRLVSAERRFERLREKFSVFLTQLEFFSQPRCPVRGVAIVPNMGAHSFRATFATVTLEFRFHLALSAEGTPSGKVVAVLAEPSFSDEAPVVGSFKFNGQGITDFEVPADADPIEMESHAVEIVAHFISLALQRDEP